MRSRLLWAHVYYVITSPRHRLGSDKDFKSENQGGDGEGEGCSSRPGGQRLLGGTIWDYVWPRSGFAKTLEKEKHEKGITLTHDSDISHPCLRGFPPIQSPLLVIIRMWFNWKEMTSPRTPLRDEWRKKKTPTNSCRSTVCLSVFFLWQD